MGAPSRADARSRLGHFLHVNALLGALNMVLGVVSERDPRAVFPCFGPDAAPYRVELCPGTTRIGRRCRTSSRSLRRAEGVGRPPDRPTDLAGGAKAARRLGMNRLAERLERASNR